MDISVVIPSKNRTVEIKRMLASLFIQATHPHETIVIDQSDEPYELEPYPGLVHVYAPELPGLTAARNAGIDRARGEVVQFFDDDVVLRSDCIAEVAKMFAACPGVIGAQCTIHNPWDDRPAGLYGLSTLIFERGFFDSRPYRRNGTIVPRLIDGLASAYRRSLFERERFDEQLPGYGLAEDWDFTKRAARHGRLIVVPGARVDHLHATTNRHDPATYARMRATNILYLFDKLRAESDWRNRVWKQWWLLGERLRKFRRQLST